jgi:site-specific DNA recombinase
MQNLQDQVTIQNGTHDAIISRETFQSVQKMLQTRTRTNTAPKKHLFTNILFCEHCQKGMLYKANQKGYRCGGNIKHGDSFCENRVVIRERELKHIILEDLKESFHSIQDDKFLKSLQLRLNRKKEINKDRLKKLNTKQ